MTEILDELPRLLPTEREKILHRIAELDGIETPELLAAIDEADAVSPQGDVSIEDVSNRVTQWAHSK
ncbi:MAG: hypothetical protein HY360_07015 [Verrucomicrobia bacterium]|nr:hypothetical protein [Verrucomicrobiota bacterium]